MRMNTVKIFLHLIIIIWSQFNDKIFSKTNQLNSFSNLLKIYIIIPPKQQKNFHFSQWSPQGCHGTLMDLRHLLCGIIEQVLCVWL